MKTIITIIIMLSVQFINGQQPIIALGNSRNSVLYDNMNLPEWKITHRSRLELTYTSDSTKVEITYFFLPDEPCKVNKTCVEVQILFTSRWWLQDYIDEKVKAGKLKQVNYCTYSLITDLYDDPVNFYIIGDKRLSIKYAPKNQK